MDGFPHEQTALPAAGHDNVTSTDTQAETDAMMSSNAWKHDHVDSKAPGESNMVGGKVMERLTAASAPGFSRPWRGVRVPRSRRRKKPAGLPKRNKLVVSNSKNRDSGTGASKFNGGGMFGCRDNTSSA